MDEWFVSHEPRRIEPFSTITYTNYLVDKNAGVLVLATKGLVYSFSYDNNKMTMLNKLIINAILTFFISASLYSQPTYSGVLQCKCGYTQRGTYDIARQAIRLHMCSEHGMGCATSQPYYPPVPVKTLQQIKAEREQKDLQEAAEDANDHGVDYYEKKDWATAINYFKTALEYKPDFEDAIYNLKKAEDKLKAERQRQEEEQKKEVVDLNIQTVTIPNHISKYLEEADKIIVPPPSWESTIHEQVVQIKIGHDAEKILFNNNYFIAAFDEVCSIAGVEAIPFKLMIIGAKSTIAAQNEPEIVVFKQTAVYERVLQVLKDKKQAPLLIAAIKALKEKKPLPAGISPELLKLAQATQNPSLGNSSVHLAMNAMLSPESKAAFFQTAKMEVLELVSDKIKEMAAGMIGKRFSALKEMNDKVTTGMELFGIEAAPSVKSILKEKIAELEKIIQPGKPVPEEIVNLMSVFNTFK